MTNKKNIRFLVISIAILCCISLVLLGASEDPDDPEYEQSEILREIDLTMNAVLLNADGEIQKNFTLPVNGPVVKVTHPCSPELYPSGICTHINYDVMIHIPEDVTSEIRWKYRLPGHGHYTNFGGENPPYMIWMALKSYEIDDTYVGFPVYFGLYEEKECLAIVWNDGEVHMILASTNPDMTVEEIKDNMSYFLDTFASREEVHYLDLSTIR